MNDLEFTDLQNALDRAIHILSSNDFDDASEYLQELKEKVRMDVYGKRND